MLTATALKRFNRLKRYNRQISLPEIGEAGQEKLGGARVLICGAGGLGSPVALYLAAAGIGSLKIVDCDSVSLDNLNRQILHGDADIGRQKVDSARETLNSLNPLVSIETSTQRINAENALQIASGADAIVDALDNLETRYVVNKAAMDLGKPLVHGAVNGFEGRVLTIIPGKSACLRCLHRGAPPAAEKFSVVGVAPAVIGALQATEVIKLILGVGEVLMNRLVVYDGLNLTWNEFKLKRNPECSHCGQLSEKGL